MGGYIYAWQHYGLWLLTGKQTAYPAVYATTARSASSFATGAVAISAAARTRSSDAEDGS